MYVNNEIQEIADKIRDTVDCEKIYLFGSYAYGAPSSHSDYDFYVIIPDGSTRPIEAMKKIYSVLAKTKMHVPVDILASYKSQFYEKSKGVSLENKISEEGIVLYERTGSGNKMA